jgi:Snurportin1
VSYDCVKEQADGKKRKPAAFVAPIYFWKSSEMADELSGFLESSLNVTLDPFGTTKQHPRFSQFKQKNNKASQEERRRLTLEIQKQ